MNRMEGDDLAAPAAHYFPLWMDLMVPLDGLNVLPMISTLERQFS